MNLYYYDFDGKLLDVLTNHDFVVKNIIGMSKDKKRLYYTATGKNPMNTVVYEYHFKKKQSNLLTPVEGTHNVKICDNGAYTYDTYSNGDTPRKTLIYTSNGKMAKLLLNAEEKLNHFSDEDINSLSGKEVMYRMGQIEWAFTAEDFILSFSLPNFYFHVTTLYDLFRVKGLEIGKLDFAGALRIKE